MLANEIFELSGKITSNDILRFYYFQALRRTWWFWALLAFFLVVLIVVAVVFTILSHGYEVARASLPLILACCFMLVIISICPYLAARKQFKTMIVTDQPVSFRFAPEGMHTQTGYSSGDTSWKAFWRVYEAKTFFCLYFSAGSALVIPKRFFASPSQQDQWQELVEAQIQPKKIERPGVVGKLL
jgi:hypothetical protein